MIKIDDVYYAVEHDTKWIPNEKFLESNESFLIRLNGAKEVYKYEKDYFGSYYRDREQVPLKWKKKDENDLRDLMEKLAEKTIEMGQNTTCFLPNNLGVYVFCELGGHEDQEWETIYYTNYEEYLRSVS